MSLVWKFLEHTNEENEKWSFLRAIEWRCFPIFISIPVMPILLLFFDWWKVVVILIIISSLWNLSVVRQKIFSIEVATFGEFFVFLKWVLYPAFMVYFFIHREYFLLIFAPLWLFLSGTLGSFSAIGTNTKDVQELIIKRLKES